MNEKLAMGSPCTRPWGFLLFVSESAVIAIPIVVSPRGEFLATLGALPFLFLWRLGKGKDGARTVRAPWSERSS